MSPPSPWKKISSEELLKVGFFRLRADRCELPDGRIMPHYYVMELADWVNVLPITHTGQVILVRQYRHAAGRDFLEIPGGSTHVGQIEDPRKAGERELLEETGYQSRRWIYCGEHYPNPAMQANRLHTFLALDCQQVAAPALDPFEDLVTEIMPFRQFKRLFNAGGFPHSLIAASIALALQHLTAAGKPKPKTKPKLKPKRSNPRHRPHRRALK